MLSVLPGDEVVDGYDLVAAREQEVGKVRAEEARTAGDHGDGFGR